MALPPLPVLSGEYSWLPDALLFGPLHVEDQIRSRGDPGAVRQSGEGDGPKVPADLRANRSNRFRDLRLEGDGPPARLLDHGSVFEIPRDQPRDPNLDRSELGEDGPPLLVPVGVCPVQRLPNGPIEGLEGLLVGWSDRWRETRILAAPPQGEIWRDPRRTGAGLRHRAASSEDQGPCSTQTGPTPQVRTGDPPEREKEFGGLAGLHAFHSTIMRGTPYISGLKSEDLRRFSDKFD